MLDPIGAGPLGPGVGEGHGVAGALPACGGLDALVEDHHDVGAEGDLDGHGVFGGEEVLAAVEVGAELDAIGVILRSLASEKTWKPPESVSMGRCQLMKR